MTRREFIAGRGAAVTWALAARAQRMAMPIVGRLHPESARAVPHIISGFLLGLTATGYVDYRNVAIEYQWAEQAASACRRTGSTTQVAVIVTVGTPAALTAKGATRTIPIELI
jgi:putative tryptophan/tyrosine transport system substrate-binding protein